MHVVVNALVATNLSARQVLLGHLARLSEWTRDRHRFTVLHHGGNRDLCRDLGLNVSWHECPPRCAGWTFRTFWESMELPPLLRRLKADLLFLCSGAVAPRAPVPQIVMALNPWSMVSTVHYTVLEKIKAAGQRRTYRSAVARAALIGYASGYLKHLYEANAGRPAARSVIAYAGLNDDVLAASAAVREDAGRTPLRIVCASLMARHKGVEIVVEALRILRGDLGVPATLHLVGGWVAAAHEREVRQRVHSLGLDSVVRFTGHVSRASLFDELATARVFCLMSNCESFGIPSVEAQAFGTPVVCADCCAIPEVCGEAGLYPPPGDAAATARALQRLLCEDDVWRLKSEASRKNAARFRYELTARPWLRMFDDDIAGRPAHG